MKVKTGFFWRTSAYKLAGLVPLAISQKVPRGFVVSVYERLAPPMELIDKQKRGEITWEEFTVEYVEKVLSKTSQREVMTEIEELTGGREAVLLCYEGSGNCHRHIVAAWLREAGVEVEEFKERKAKNVKIV